MTTTFIYALCDPDTQLIRYVGKTTNLPKRFRRHLQDNDNTYKSRWINKLKSQGKIPVHQILEETDESHWEELEKKWIAHYRAISGNKLTNITDGGECGSKKGFGKGRHLSEETKRKISEFHKGFRHSIETRKKHSEELRKRWANPEYKKKLSIIRTGKKRNKETCERISKALKLKYQTNPELRKTQGKPETRKKQSETSKKIWTDEKRKEHSEILKKLWADSNLRKRQSQISKEMWSNPEHRKKLSEIGKKRWADPQLKEKLSRESKERWKNSEYREKRLATFKLHGGQK